MQPALSKSKELNFKIQLLSGKNVVLVECPGFESELFMPQIVKGRITFQNIIPNRKCCQESRMLTDSLKADMGTRPGSSKSPPRRSLLDVNLSTPLAKSTPSSSSFPRAQADKENVLPQLTPEVVRCRPFQLTSLGEVDMDVVSMSEMLCQEQASKSQNLPSPHPQLAAYQSESLSGTQVSPPVLSRLSQASVQSKEHGLNKSTPKIPPVRTYARKKVGTAGKTKPAPVWSPLLKKKKNPSVSSTKVPSPTMKLEVRHRKLIVDTKKTLDVRDPNKLCSAPISMNKIIRKQVTGKTRKQFQALKVTAFDLLTNPCISSMSDDLIKQFQKSCANKICTTLPNYAEIAVASPLKMDREVKAMVARQKRMERNEKPKCVLSLKSKLV
ncbi:uncharacterized protein LOC108029752 [Drosophila biarmipes]|uniref:uncharacterized protein LOC108029752 n=1 Tax=Drosophila biarmipes TaxID=125945 RepID=UPI0007E70D22|nr:uncharacterized protein LOC108029752 [Drosophila biarmipes]